MRRFAAALLSLAIAAGLVLAVWPLGQTLYGKWSQHTLEEQWQHQEHGVPRPVKASKTVKTVRVPARLALASGESAPHDADSPAPALPNQNLKQAARWPLTKLTIPDISLETFVVQGMDSAALRRGPGHDVNSGLPGEGNCVVAGHRNVYGSFFYRLDELMPGSSIILENADGKFTYTVNTLVTTPDTNLTILQPPPVGAPPVLTLITCTLPHSSNRIVVQAFLEAP